MKQQKQQKGHQEKKSSNKKENEMSSLQQIFIWFKKALNPQTQNWRAKG